MNTKLTLRLDSHLIASAKKYSIKTGKPVSRIVADLFEIIQNEQLNQKEPLSPGVQSLKGALKGTNIDENHYKKYLEEKYL